jgi:hypothetical protein
MAVACASIQGVWTRLSGAAEKLSAWIQQLGAPEQAVIGRDGKA